MYQEMSKNVEFSMFLRSLDSLKSTLEGQTTIILDGKKNPAINLLKEGPKNMGGSGK